MLDSTLLHFIWANNLSNKHNIELNTFENIETHSEKRQKMEYQSISTDFCYYYVVFFIYPAKCILSLLILQVVLFATINAIDGKCDTHTHTLYIY